MNRKNSKYKFAFNDAHNDWIQLDLVTIFRFHLDQNTFIRKVINFKKIAQNSNDKN